MKKSLIILIAIVGVAISVHGQEYRTDISIREQVLKGQQPAMKYAPEAVAKTAEESKIPSYASMRFSQAVREGKIGVPVAHNTGTTSIKKNAIKRSDVVKLPSEMSTEEIKAEAEAAKRAADVKHPVIVQNEFKENEKPDKKQ